MVDLQQAQPADHAAEMAGIDTSPRARTIEALGRERHTARFPK
ncbi:MAG: hypothetical protein ACE5HQ_02160 [Gemmatimonadota bacterium]